MIQSHYYYLFKKKKKEEKNKEEENIGLKINCLTVALSDSSSIKFQYFIEFFVLYEVVGVQYLIIIFLAMIKYRCKRVETRELLTDCSNFLEHLKHCLIRCKSQVEDRSSVPLIIVSPAHEILVLKKLFSDNDYFAFDSEKVGNPGFLSFKYSRAVLH